MGQSSPVLNLFFPQWQGAAQRSLYDGAQALYANLQNSASFTAVSVGSTYSLETRSGILGHHQIVDQLRHAHQSIKTAAPEKMVTLGGDCGVEIAPISFLNARYQTELAVLWLDAHADLNTPQTSPSQRFHGMPLRALLGDSDTEITEQAFSQLQPKQVFLVGTREFDAPELEFSQQKKLAVFSADRLATAGFDTLLTSLKQANFTKLYIHLDLDVLDPAAFPHVTCPTPGGLSPDVLIRLLQQCDREFDIVGFSLLEFCPRSAPTAAALEVVRLINQVRLPFAIF